MLDKQKADRGIYFNQTSVAKFDKVPQILFVMLTLIGIAGVSVVIGFADAMTRLVRSDFIQ